MTDYVKLLQSFKRSNKDRKLKIAQKAGFSNIVDYLIYLAKGISEDLNTSKIDPATLGKTTKKVVTEETTDLVIAFDTTSSMNSYIQAVRKHVRELIPKLFSQNPGLKISIVAFGDYCDMDYLTAFGKAYQVAPLTDDANLLINFVNSAQGTSGGDIDEFYELVIKKITEETLWRKGSNKSVLLIGDADPHQPGYRYSTKSTRHLPTTAQIDWKEEATKAASLGIKFDTLRIHKESKWYQELSDITQGLCLDFSNSSKTSDLLEATALARGGSTTLDAFMTKSVSSDVTGDAEINKVYSMYKTVIDKK